MIDTGVGCTVAPTSVGLSVGRKLGACVGDGDGACDGSGIVHTDWSVPGVPELTVVYPGEHGVHVLAFPGVAELYVPCGQAVHPLVPSTLDPA